MPPIMIKYFQHLNRTKKPDRLTSSLAAGTTYKPDDVSPVGSIAATGALMDAARPTSVL